MIALIIQDHKCLRAKNSSAPRPIYDAAFSASRLRCSNRARYIRRTKKSKLTSRPAISRRFVTRFVIRERSRFSGRSPSTLCYCLLVPTPGYDLTATTTPPMGNPFQRGRYQTWTNRGPVTRRRPLRRAARRSSDAMSILTPSPSCARVYNPLNNSAHRRRVPCSFQRSKKVSTKKTV